MAAEDAQLKAFYANEKVLEAKEAKLMKVEDTNMQYLYRWERWEKEIMKEVNIPNYSNLEFVEKELEDSKKLFKKYNWPLIDVTRKSVEETAATVIRIYDIKKGQKK